MLAAVFIGFIGHAVFHIEPSVVALLGAGVLVLLSRSKPRDFMPSVEWETLLFFAGLFIMIGALVKTGVIGQLADAAARATGGDPLDRHHADPVRLRPAQRHRRQHPLHRGHEPDRRSS